MGQMGRMGEEIRVKKFGWRNAGVGGCAGPGETAAKNIDYPPRLPGDSKMERLLLLVFLVPAFALNEISPDKGISKQQLENWAAKFAGPLFEFGRSVTKYTEIQGRFQQSDSTVERIKLESLVKDFSNEIHTNFKEKVEAIRKISSWAEEKALEFYEKPRTEKLSEEYKNVRELKDADDGLVMDYHFGAKVNTSYSAVHVPTPIWDKDPTILEGVGWSSNMDDIFKSNYNSNPSLQWQYFGSATGFLRQYPAMKWPNDNSKKSSPDLYDARMRPWYVSSANSPKNMVILHDTSGSMTGLRREIAKHVVYTILETLTENDYVNVFNFSDETTPVVPCFNGLVQANLENVREFKIGLEQDRTSGIANFSAALNLAFDVLEKSFQENDSSSCNQAIMLITDGAPYYFDEIFKLRQNPMHHVRIFTYLIGREVTDLREIKWMACSNKGYYVHVATLGEVQEKVVKYLPVMSRPMVMFQAHDITWTPVYADIAEIVESDWIWEDKNRKWQRERSERYKQFLKMWANESGGRLDFADEDKSGEEMRINISKAKVQSFLDTGMVDATEYKLRKKFAEEERIRRATLRHWGPDRKFRFVISASLPVFDQRNSTINSERIANFLGVAGTDIPIEDLKRMASPFKLGVHGYSFIVTNNGYVVYHPEWRPLHRNDMMKTNYNVVDLSEVELVDNDKTWRNNDSQLLEMRRDMIDQEHNFKTLRVRIPMDDFKRVSIRDRRYEYMKIENTPYSLGVSSLKELNAFHGIIDIFRLYRDHGLNATTFFDKGKKRNWKLNPDWSYCDYIRESEETKAKRGGVRPSKEDLLLHFLTRIQSSNSGWAWRNTGYGVKPRHNRVLEGDIYTCSRIVGDDDESTEENVSENFEASTTPTSLLSESLEFSGEFGNSTNSTESAEPTSDTYEYQRDEGVPIDKSASFESFEPYSWEFTMQDDEMLNCIEGDRDLILSLLFDANVTQIFTQTREMWKVDKNESQIIEMYGALLAFIATRSGLTRWFEINKDREVEIPFHENNDRATDEIWYKRAVERYEVDSDSFVFSVPFDAGTRNDSIVTASRAIFAKKNGRQAPVAVVGIHFNHSKWSERFLEITSGCVEANRRESCNKTCASEEFDCYVLDDNGFILYSEKHKDTGRFFGEVDGMVLDMLVNADVYKRVKVVDYQAVCYHPISHANFADFLWTPFTHLKWMARWVFAHVATVLIRMELSTWFTPQMAAFADSIVEDSFSEEGSPNSLPFLEMASINQTKMRPCDKEYELYTYGELYNPVNFTFHGLLKKCGHSGCNGYFNVHYIPHTNLILIVTDGRCQCIRNATTITAKELIYMNIEDDEDLESSQVCRAPLNPLYRKRPSDTCYAYNSEEDYIKEDCGFGSRLTVGGLTALIAMITLANFFL